MQQIELSLPERRLALAREQGEQAAQACVTKAERVSDFDPEGAVTFIVGWLARHGDASGEDLVDAAKEHGHRPHSDRAFGPVFKTILKRQLARVVRSDLPRRRGHATTGGKLWRVAR